MFVEVDEENDPYSLDSMEDPVLCYLVSDLDGVMLQAAIIERESLAQNFRNNAEYYITVNYTEISRSYH